MNAKLELYTRPTCSDCQEAKAFLGKNNIQYNSYDLSLEPQKEKELIKVSGSRVVPAFVFKKKSFLGLGSKPKVLIGFERNEDEIKRLLSL
ncbi:glutaredoxin family protein [Sporosarcina aquimarina]|uniref:glutaredoxin family protein n=1 Tax=Sporosarcina aquimarina TaxID=114975 RepID=UPI00203B73AB|nr:glutaredoxin family protein [Sporosarcina aquimarina]MCM3759138.1 glutaredoxin family protein [Sporosarcina aquimarina]